MQTLESFTAVANVFGTTRKVTYDTVSGLTFQGLTIAQAQLLTEALEHLSPAQLLHLVRGVEVAPTENHAQWQQKVVPAETVVDTTPPTPPTPPTPAEEPIVAQPLVDTPVPVETAQEPTQETAQNYVFAYTPEPELAAEESAVGLSAPEAPKPATRTKKRPPLRPGVEVVSEAPPTSKASPTSEPESVTTPESVQASVQETAPESEFAAAEEATVPDEIMQSKTTRDVVTYLMSSGVADTDAIIGACIRLKRQGAQAFAHSKDDEAVRRRVNSTLMVMGQTQA